PISSRVSSAASADVYYRQQDEDQGQLGAWFVLASIGLFDAKGLTAPNPSFQIGSPLFDKVTITLNPQYYSGKEFVIETVNNTSDNDYIQTMTLNGKSIKSIQLPFAEVAKGGNLSISLGANPNEHLTH
ncbi:MAG: glycoside hydrolase family 92 protein, partial [Duncaniella sp.]|nr:glycoside hydrolase family 92 protein [Duncaniella sp.]